MWYQQNALQVNRFSFFVTREQRPPKSQKYAGLHSAGILTEQEDEGCPLPWAEIFRYSSDEQTKEQQVHLKDNRFAVISLDLSELVPLQAGRSPFCFKLPPMGATLHLLLVTHKTALVEKVDDVRSCRLRRLVMVNY